MWSKGYVETWPGEDTTASKALSTVVQGTTVGLSSMKPGSFRWSWGDLRGGTPALYVGDNRYLTFFHSSNEPPATGRTDHAINILTKIDSYLMRVYSGVKGGLITNSLLQNDLT